MQDDLKEQAKEIASFLALKDKLFFALLRHHPEVWEEILKDDELHPYAKLLQQSINS